MIHRQIEARLLKAAKEYPVVALLGPRQSGKTTLAKFLFKDKPYVSLENLDHREFATNDPRGFLNQFSSGAIFDEVQNVPDLFSYLQEVVDESGKNGQFILTGSQNFLLHEKITQSLAGRVALRTLLPLSYQEIHSHNSDVKLEEIILKGGYPRLYNEAIDSSDWLLDYIQTYLERDVRLIKNIGDLNTFHKFLKICASRVGQLTNYSQIADDCGIQHNTAKSWLSVLNSSYITFELLPHHKNFGKRLVKSSKIYFYDTGLVCSLLGLSDVSQWRTHAYKGSLFENWVIGELKKQKLNFGKKSEFYFWQEHRKKEIDCLIDNAGELIPLEIKAGETVTQDYFKQLKYWNSLSGRNSEKTYLVYAGSQGQERSDVTVLPWNKIDGVTFG